MRGEDMYILGFAYSLVEFCGNFNISGEFSIACKEFILNYLDL